MQQFYFYILDRRKKKYTYTEIKSVYCTTIITNNMLLMLMMQAHFKSHQTPTDVFLTNINII